MPAPAQERGWKNVFKMQPGYMTTILVQFSLLDSEQPYPFNASAEPGYVYHCHVSPIFFIQRSIIPLYPNFWIAEETVN